MRDELSVAIIEELIAKMPPAPPNAARINQRTLDALRQHIDFSDAGTPFSAMQISVAEGMPDGQIAFGWNQPGGGFKLEAIYIIKDFK